MRRSAQGDNVGRLRRFVICLVVALLVAPRPAGAYSVLAHESNIDALWDAQIRPLLLAKYPGTSTGPWRRRGRTRTAGP